MNTRAWYPLIAASLVVAALVSSASAAPADGIALAIVYDTSGSMKESVRDGAGKYSPKYKIANRSLSAIARQIAAIATNSARPIHAGLFTFDGAGTREVVKFGPFDAAAIQKFADTFSSPGSGTPLGAALDTAGRRVLNSDLPRKHVLVITDGMNTVGRDPAAVLPGLKKDAERKQTGFSVHFVAFDVDAKVFNGVKKLGATVVGAADEKQLNTQLDFILQRKILLEDEEPPKPQ